MEKVTAIIASQQKRATYGAVRTFEAQLRALGEVEFEYVFLKDYRLENCRGCGQCFEKGEEHCPIKDDRDLLIQKISGADGVVLATPNYAFQVAGAMKTLLDRMAFTLHRPRYFGKAFTSIVTEGIHGGKGIVKYLDSAIGRNWGFTTSKGCVLRALGEQTEVRREKNERAARKAAARFYKELTRPALPAPSLFRLMLFRMSRSGVRAMLTDANRDYRHYSERGWFENDYYYPVALGPIKRAAGSLFDYMGRQMAGSR